MEKQPNTHTNKQKKYGQVGRLKKKKKTTKEVQNKGIQTHVHQVLQSIIFCS